MSMISLRPLTENAFLLDAFEQCPPGGNAKLRVVDASLERRPHASCKYTGW